MPSSSELSFGQRYTKARDLVEYLKTIPAYAPGVTEITAANLETFLDSVDSANTDVASSISSLQTTRDERFNLFKDANGLLIRSAQIRDYVGSIHAQHKKALDYKKIQKYVQGMRGFRISKKPLNPDGSPGKSNSTSEQSYGSMLRAGKDILEVIKTVPGYSPTNTNLTVANFTTFLASVDAKNTEVAAKLESYDNFVEARSNLYIQLADKITKVKLAISSQFGKSSNEYKDVVKY